MADPERLYYSARRLYGDDMERLWGEMKPVPEDNLEILTGGESLLDGRFEVAYTPGHASHHVSYLHEGTAFVGDVGGVRITPDSITIPPTPPPDVDVELWHESIATVRAWRPDRLAITHFGGYDRVDRAARRARRRLDAWSRWPADGDREALHLRRAAGDPRPGEPRAGRHLPAGGAGRAAVRRLRALLEEAVAKSSQTGPGPPRRRYAARQCL